VAGRHDTRIGVAQNDEICKTVNMDFVIDGAATNMRSRGGQSCVRHCWFD
jgi:hypothetical protein